MSRDNWERLVAAVVKREQIWQLCHDHSRSPSISTMSSDSSEQIPEMELNSVSPPPQRTLSNSSLIQGQPTMASIDVQNLTPSGLKFGREAETRKQSRLWPWEAFWRRPNPSKDPQLFTLKQIKAATNNFNPANKICEDESGSVYRGKFSGGTIAAVKQFPSKSKREFVIEAGLLTTSKHPNLIKIHGYCNEGERSLLVYEFVENHSLSRALFGNDTTQKLKLDWPTRKRICLGIARGLAYIHEESRLKIIHRDINTSNVLLDKDLNAKISKFGQACLNEDDKTRVSARIVGTSGYVAPEYVRRGFLTNKTDVYSYGVVALEIVSGRRLKDGSTCHLDWDYVLQEKGTLLELVDPDLGSEYSSEEAIMLLNVALLCTSVTPTLRPKMSQVVNILESSWR